MPSPIADDLQKLLGKYSLLKLVLTLMTILTPDQIRSVAGIFSDSSNLEASEESCDASGGGGGDGDDQSNTTVKKSGTCRFGTACKNQKCKFSHEPTEMECRYGLNCKHMETCLFAHSDQIAHGTETVDQLLGMVYDFIKKQEDGNANMASIGINLTKQCKGTPPKIYFRHLFGENGKFAEFVAGQCEQDSRFEVETIKSGNHTRYTIKLNDDESESESVSTIDD